LSQHHGLVEKEKIKLAELEDMISETRGKIDKCPESMRGSMEEKLHQVGIQRRGHQPF